MTQNRGSQAAVIVIPCPDGSRHAMARVCPAGGGQVFMPISALQHQPQLWAWPARARQHPVSTQSSGLCLPYHQ